MLKWLCDFTLEYCNGVMVKDYNGENFKLRCDATKNGEAVKC